jgi:PKD repeat protein
MKRRLGGRWLVLSWISAWLASLTTLAAANAAETPYLYGIHDHDPSPQEFLDHLAVQGRTGWVTATVAIGSDRTDLGGGDFSGLAAPGHTVIVRLNNGYCPDGAIPPPFQYADFARRAANYARASRGAHIWVIGNETNLPWEWPVANGRAAYVSPQSYAQLFRMVYDEIKRVRPEDKVIPQALAPFAGPFGPGTMCNGAPHDGNPLNWVQYMSQMLTAIQATGPLDGIALHINSRGYTYDAIHSTQKVSAGGESLYFSFYVYKDWVELGIPKSLYHLPLYATEANGLYFWKGGHPENPAAHYERGFIQEIYAEIDRYNQRAAATGKPVFRCVNLYRWCAWCDGWNIDGSAYKGQILSDLDEAARQGYRWPDAGGVPPPVQPPGQKLGPAHWAASSSYSADFGGDKAYDGVVSAASKWTSDGASSESWLALDLGATHDVTGFIVHHAGAAGELTGFNTQAFRLESGSSLLGPWVSLVAISNTDQKNVTTTVLATPVFTRFVRLYISDAGIDNYARIPELEVYGTADGGQPPAPGRLVNGDFEASAPGTGPTAGWKAFASSGYGAGFSVVSDPVHGGAGSQRILSPQPTTTDQYAGVYQTVATEPGQFYLVRAWNRTSFARGNAWDHIARLGMDLAGGTDFGAASVGWTEFDSAKETWHRLELRVTATGSSMTLFLQSWRKWASGGDAQAWFDDVDVVAESEPPPNRPPRAVALADPTSGAAPLTVAFSGTGSSDPDGDALALSWSFGDGSQGSGATVSHTYASPGAYTATLTVSDGRGGSATAAVTVTATAPPPVDPVVNGDFSRGLEGWSLWTERGTLAPTVIGGQLQLGSSNHNGGVYQQFSTGGAGRTISLTGFWASSPAAAQNQWAEVLVINSSRLPVDGQDVDGGQSDVILIYKNDTWASPSGWSGNMDQTSPVANQGSFVSGGPVATLVFKSGNLGGISTGTRFDDIRVRGTSPVGNQPPNARIAANPTSGRAPLAVTFDGSGSTDPDGDALTFRWSFGDGTEGSGATVPHTYPSQGTFQAALTVDDGRGGRHTASVTIAVAGGGVLPPYCPAALDFEAIRAQLNAQGKDLAFNKIGFHAGPGGNHTGLGNWMTCLDAAGVPFFLKSVSVAGPILEAARLKAASGVPHTLVYRRCCEEYELPNYDLPAQQAAEEHWQRHRQRFPRELEPYKHLVWVETINEPDKNRREWLAEFSYYTALLAMADGFNYAAFAWSSGEPESEHWQGPWMRSFLELAGNNPERVAVALHEYDYGGDNVRYEQTYPFLIGRFERLFSICDGWGIPRPTVVITEFGRPGSYDLPSTLDLDVPWAARLYARHPQVKGAALWYLGVGGPPETWQLIGPLTGYSLQNYFEIP